MELYAKPSLKMLRNAIASGETPEQKMEKPIREADEAMMKPVNYHAQALLGAPILSPPILYYIFFYPCRTF